MAASERKDQAPKTPEEYHEAIMALLIQKHDAEIRLFKYIKQLKEFRANFEALKDELKKESDDPKSPFKSALVDINHALDDYFPRWNDLANKTINNMQDIDLGGYGHKFTVDCGGFLSEYNQNPKHTSTMKYTYEQIKGNEHFNKLIQNLERFEKFFQKVAMLDKFPKYLEDKKAKQIEEAKQAESPARAFNEIVTHITTLNAFARQKKSTQPEIDVKAFYEGEAKERKPKVTVEELLKHLTTQAKAAKPNPYAQAVLSALDNVTDKDSLVTIASEIGQAIENQMNQVVSKQQKEMNDDIHAALKIIVEKVQELQSKLPKRTLLDKQSMGMFDDPLRGKCKQLLMDAKGQKYNKDETIVMDEKATPATRIKAVKKDLEDLLKEIKEIEKSDEEVKKAVNVKLIKEEDFMPKATKSIIQHLLDAISQPPGKICEALKKEFADKKLKPDWKIAP